MTDFVSALVGWIVSAEPVSADLGARLYPLKVPQGATLPYARYQVISDPRPEHLKGYDGDRVSRVQIDIFAETYAEARRIAANIIAAVATPGAHDGVHFGRVKAEGPRDLGEDTDSGFKHRASIDLLVEHKLA